MLSLLRHLNLVSLIGYCADGDQRLLVYEFMALGSLEDHLHGTHLPQTFLFIGFRFSFLFSSSYHREVIETSEVSYAQSLHFACDKYDKSQFLILSKADSI